MPEIRQMVVTAKIDEKNKAILESLVGSDHIKYFEPFSYPQMMKMAAMGKTKEEIIKATVEHKRAISDFVKTNNPDVAVLGEDIDASILSGNGMKWIHCTHAGIEKSASSAIFEKGITVTSSAGRNAAGLAEHAMLFILSLAFDSNRIRDCQTAHKFNLGPDYKNRTAIYGKTVGIIGCGHNGTEIAKRLKPFGVKVLGYDRMTREDENFSEILEANKENLHKIAAEADFLVLTVSLNDKTFHMVDESLLASMKPTAYLVNIARGGLVDEAALVAALESHKIAGAALDTFEKEPLDAQSPLWDMPNVICTPHTTPSVMGMIDKEWEYVFNNVKAYANGGKFENVISVEDVYTKGVK